MVVPFKLEIQPPKERDQPAIDAARLQRRLARAKKRVLALGIAAVGIIWAVAS
jgi:hypothetical protein